MPALQVKDCPADVYESLRACAAKENRSISQQALTIIQKYLASQSSLQGPDQAMQSRDEHPYAIHLDNANYAAKRAKAFERIRSMPPLPVSPSSPSASDLLASIRKEEAR